MSQSIITVLIKKISRFLLIVCLVSHCVSVVHSEESHKENPYGRFIQTEHKLRVACPAQTSEMAVLLAIGQSNAANDAEEKHMTRYPKKVVNYFEGKCYVAASPLLGATGESGEFVTLLADHLIKNHTYQSVVIISAAIGATPISRWQRGGDLNTSLLAILLESNKNYRITHILWHQGETDFANKTSSDHYVKSFRSLVDSLSSIDVAAPIFIAISTKCIPGWYEKNPTALAQMSLVDNKKIFLGANTDILLEDKDRRDACHFSKTGQIKTAHSYFDAIRKQAH